MQSKASTVAEYLDSLPDDRRAGIEAMRRAVREHLDPGFEEGMQYGMVGYYVPHRLYPDGYHCDPRQPLPFGGVASQKNHLTIYFMHLYMFPDELKWFEKEYAKTGKKLDMGKSCIRFKKLEDIPLELLGRTVQRISVDRYIQLYEQVVGPKKKESKATSSKTSVTKKTSTAKKKVTKTAVTNKTATKKTATKKATTRKATKATKKSSK